MTSPLRECCDCGDTYVPHRDTQYLCTDCSSAHRDAWAASLGAFLVLGCVAISLALAAWGVR